MAFTFENVRHIVEGIADERFNKNYTIKIKEEQFSGDNFTTNIVRVQIQENFKDDEDKNRNQINLFIKLNALSKEIRESMLVMPIFETELRAYKELLPEMCRFQDKYDIPLKNQFFYPKFIAGDATLYNEYMIFEDLSYDGYEMYGRRKLLDFEHGEVLLKHLARYHAISFAMKQNDPLTYDEMLKKVTKIIEFPETFKQLIINMCDKTTVHMKCERRKEIIREFVQESGDLMKRRTSSEFTEPYNVITHGDFHINNMLFKREDGKLKVIFVDWQLLNYQSPVKDLIQCIYVSTDKKFRDKHFRSLCDIYYNTLEKTLKMYGCENIAQIYPRTIFDKHLNDMMPFAFNLTVITGGLLLAKPGEEFKLDAMINDNEMQISPTEELTNRLEGIADEIEIWNASNNDGN